MLASECPFPLVEGKSTPPCEEIVWVAKERNGPCLYMCGDIPPICFNIDLSIFPHSPSFRGPQRKYGNQKAPFVNKVLFAAVGTRITNEPVILYPAVSWLTILPPGQLINGAKQRIKLLEIFATGKGDISCTGDDCNCCIREVQNCQPSDIRGNNETWIGCLVSFPATVFCLPVSLMQSPVNQEFCPGLQQTVRCAPFHHINNRLQPLSIIDCNSHPFQHIGILDLMKSVDI
ncbi:hypothetical protein CEXT_709741 [Caerostris extrusa]|uniref:DUF4773 domain-containing protein n=1 Tax=Caerostris extrusa TaxID=172846 RepID=A0AAV4SSD0_CAEEX|nr:hypothetical protein CEXT_709741 [Caerostris extrusa]